MTSFYATHGDFNFKTVGVILFPEYDGAVVLGVPNRAS
jgi:hypothetical protein